MRLQESPVQDMQPTILPAAGGSYFAELPAWSFDERGEMLERLMSFAFDVLGVRHFEVRVYGAAPVHLQRSD